jgi:adenylyl-sulfate kinase
MSIIIWFTGMSGSGKTTLGRRLAAHFEAQRLAVSHLDGDVIRQITGNADFSRQGRERNIDAVRAHLIAHAADNDLSIVSAITPYRSMRDKNRAELPGYFEIFCNCPIPALIDRDPKGLYKAALAGKIQHFTGIDDPFETPLAPDIVVDTASQSVDASVASILAALAPRLNRSAA